MDSAATAQLRSAAQDAYQQLALEQLPEVARRQVLAAAWRGLAWTHGRPVPAVSASELLPAVGDAAAEYGRPDALGIVHEALLEASSRRAAGSHYTPLELAAELVRHGLRPLLDSGRHPLDLRVADPALGGGVFLLEVCRQLAEELGDGPHTRRAVAEHCLYGVDQDPVAVEVCRSSLRLFVNDATWDAAALTRHLQVGDALVGPPTEAAQWPVEPFDWPGLYPEVFARGGFDLVVGNPPFLGGSYITGTRGAAYRDFLVKHLAGGRRGNADLCAFFFLRAAELIRPDGRCGLLATNTIAEGETRQVGLDQLLERGYVIDRAERQRKWPGKASLHVSLVWLRHGGSDHPAMLDGRRVQTIDASLSAGLPARGDPAKLPENRSIAFCGTKIYGQGFLLTPDEAAALLDQDARHADALRPYLSGDDLNGRPDRTPSRWVICFHDWPLERAAEYPLLLDIVRRRVKPERDRLLGRNQIGTHRAERWWQFGSPAPGLYRAIAGRQEVLAKVLHSQTHAVARVGSEAVFSHGLAVFATDQPAILAVLQSALHEAWSVRWGSSLGIAPRYTPSKTFETYPLPATEAGLEAIGRRFAGYRTEVMAARGEGLTALARRCHDRTEQSADIRALRGLQTELDQAVAAAYGWAELELGRDFRETPRGVRYAIRPATEQTILQRLLWLNQARAAAADSVGRAVLV